MNVQFTSGLIWYTCLHCALASCGAVYCNRSCLWVCGGRTDGRAGGVRTLLQPALAQCLRLSERFFIRTVSVFVSIMDSNCYRIGLRKIRRASRLNKSANKPKHCYQDYMNIRLWYISLLSASVWYETFIVAQLYSLFLCVLCFTLFVKRCVCQCLIKNCLIDLIWYTEISARQTRRESLTEFDAGSFVAYLAHHDTATFHVVSRRYALEFSKQLASALFSDSVNSAQTTIYW